MKALEYFVTSHIGANVPFVVPDASSTYAAVTSGAVSTIRISLPLPPVLEQASTSNNFIPVRNGVKATLRMAEPVMT